MSLWVRGPIIVVGLLECWPADRFVTCRGREMKAESFGKARSGLGLRFDYLLFFGFFHAFRALVVLRFLSTLRGLQATQHVPIPLC